MIQESFKTKFFLKSCCTFVTEEGKISVNSRKPIFHSTWMALEHASVHACKTTGELTKKHLEDDKAFDEKNDGNPCCRGQRRIISYESKEEVYYKKLLFKDYKGF